MTGAGKKLPPDYLVSQKEIDDANDELDIGSYLLPGGQSAPLPDMDSPPHRTAEPSAIFSAHDTDDDDFQEASPSQRGHSGSQFRGTAPSHSGEEAGSKPAHSGAARPQYSHHADAAQGSTVASQQVDQIQQRQQQGQQQQQQPQRPPAALSHVDDSGRASMVDVTQKADTARVAVASARVLLGPVAFQLVAANQIAKGDVLTVSKLAGIMAAKQTAYLIPLCHPLMLSKVDVQLRLDAQRHSISITGSVTAVGRTGVEMEALTAVSVAALTVYDMCKAVSKDIVISDIQLDSKRGGKSGDYNR
ncbi:MAG: hypothetical protein WDW38_001266 [Sanguina aurantia]